MFERGEMASLAHQTELFSDRACQILLSVGKSRSESVKIIISDRLTHGDRKVSFDLFQVEFLTLEITSMRSLPSKSVESSVFII